MCRTGTSAHEYCIGIEARPAFALDVQRSTRMPSVPSKNNIRRSSSTGRTSSRLARRCQSKSNGVRSAGRASAAILSVAREVHARSSRLRRMRSSSHCQPTVSRRWRCPKRQRMLPICWPSSSVGISRHAFERATPKSPRGSIRWAPTMRPVRRGKRVQNR